MDGNKYDTGRNRIQKELNSGSKKKFFTNSCTKG